jgi:hypothetical protein
MTVAYDEFISPLIKSAQELTKLNKDFTQKLDLLLNENFDIKSRLLVFEQK